MQHLIISLPVAKLEADQRRIRQEIVRLEDQLKFEIDPDVDEADPGLTNQTLIIALLNNARQKAAAIEQALTQARSGGYGLCEACGQRIDVERLKIFPQATLCVPCKASQEKTPRYWRHQAA